MSGESVLQAFYVKILHDYGCLARKVRYQGRRGCPDLLCVPQNRPAFMIEVKNPNGKGRLSEYQEDEIATLNDYGMAVYVCDTKEEIFDIINREGLERDPTTSD